MNLSLIVEEELNRSPFVSEALQAGIVNISSLARYLLPQITSRLGEDTSEAAIAMAIKRLPPHPEVQLDKSISKFMRHLGDITVRSDLADFSYRNSDSLLQCQAALIEYMNSTKDYYYSFCKGVNETTIVCSEAIGSELKRIFDKEKLIVSRKDLAAVSVNLPPDNLDTYGVYYTILKRLAWKGINIVEVLSTSHEISLIIEKDDVELVFSIIHSLKRG